MINVSIVGIGGQGSVLAARILAQAALAKGWQVRTAETIGMAQRGGNVASHVRMGNADEAVYVPLPANGEVDVLIALEPGEGARSLHLLKEGGLLVSATTGVGAPAFERKAPVYNAAEVLADLRAKGVNLVEVADEHLCMKLGNRKALNIIMLASALAALDEPFISLGEMREAVRVLVKPEFVDMNLEAIQLVEGP